MQYSRAGWHSAEPYELEPERADLVDQAVKAHVGDGLTVDEIAQIADLWSDEFDFLYIARPEKHLRLVERHGAAG